VTAGRRVVLVLVLGVGAALGLWFGLRRHPASPEPLGAEAQRFVGKWTFVEGTIKSDWDFQGAGKENHELPLAGRSITVVERDGALWTAMEGNACSEMLTTKAPNVLELVAGRTVCPEQAPDAGKKSRPKSTQLTISLDASGRARVTGASQFSLEFNGAAHEGHLDYAGVAEKAAADVGR
jgi:hypothetical protein